MSDSIALTLASPPAAMLPAEEEVTAYTPPTGTPLSTWFALVAILLLGFTLRCIPWHGFQWVGFDENLYKAYVEKVDALGVSSYPEIAQEYVVRQRATEKAFLPPTRFLYIFCAATWRAAFYGDAPATKVETLEDVDRNPTLRSLRGVSALFTCLTLLVAAVFARRLAGDRAMLAVTALMACAPTQLHMSQHGLIDGFFAFWAITAVWLLWENLQAPNDARWLTAYAATLALMVLTKENSAFVTVAICITIAVAHWARWGRVTAKLIACTIIGPAVGLAILVTLAGGPEVFIATYQLLVTKAQGLRYAIATGDGPWYRYVIDLALASPLILLLAVAALLNVKREHRGLLFLGTFIAASYVFMCNVKYGMNLRYTNMWDMPLRLLAVTQLGWFAARFPNRENVLFGALIAGLAVFDLHQYQVLFVNFDRDYEMITANLLQAVKMLKFMPME